MAKKTRDEIVMKVATIAAKIPDSPELDDGSACNMLIDAMTEGQSSMSEDVFNGGLCGIAYLLHTASQEHLRSTPPAGTA